ncbi:MAG: hypothetical protein MUC58_00435 [Rhizobiaceae bacterium]|nr:hypothetical protein [Rhizobiaceae bacterium]
MPGKDAATAAKPRHFGRKAHSPDQPRQPGAAVRLRREPVMQDVFDAEFETIPAGAPAACRDKDRSGRTEFFGKPASDAKAGMALFGDPAALTAQERENRPAFYGLSAALVALSFWVSGGHAFLERASHGPAPSSVLLTSEEWQVLPGQGLSVSAVLLNTGATPANAAPVAIRVALADGRRMDFRIGTAGQRIPAGGALPVSARLDLTATASVAPAAGLALDKAPMAIDTVEITLAPD